MVEGNDTELGALRLLQWSPQTSHRRHFNAVPDPRTHNSQAFWYADVVNDCTWLESVAVHGVFVIRVLFSSRDAHSAVQGHVSKMLTDFDHC